MSLPDSVSQVHSSFYSFFFYSSVFLALPDRRLSKNLNKIAGLNRFVSENSTSSTEPIKLHTRVSFFWFCFNVLHWKILPSHNVYCVGSGGLFLQINISRFFSVTRMTKKKHHNNSTSPDSTSESGDENQNNSECNHISKALDFPKVKRLVSKSGLLLECQECKKQEPLDMPDIELDRSLWLCLRCGNQAGGRANCRHALDHYNKPHSDSHAVCVNTTTWSIWCYDCDNEVNVTRKKKLDEAVEFLKKQSPSIKENKPIVDYSSKVRYHQ